MTAITARNLSDKQTRNILKWGFINVERRFELKEKENNKKNSILNNDSKKFFIKNLKV